MEEKNFGKMPLIGEKAPHFTAVTTHGTVNFPEDYEKKWVVLFSHPSDFTPVCTTEFMAFEGMRKDFEKKNVQLIGLSIDSLFSHIAWVDAIKNYEIGEQKNVNIGFPIIEDLKMEVANLYGMIQATSANQTVRAVFVIDDKGIVRSILYYPSSNGRNIPEILRLVTALQKTDKEGVVTPANWEPGKDVLLPPPHTNADAKNRKLGKDGNLECIDWYLCFKKDK